ncbi:MAG: hypothetical protein ACK5MV_14330 [Aminipila sp.]
MEKFFKINKDSKMYIDYFKYLKNEKAVIAIFNSIAEKHGIEAGSFVPFKEKLYILPTENDNAKFDGVLTLEDTSGKRQFKIRSEIGKEWKEAVSNIEILDKPRYFMYGQRMMGQFSSRLFHIKEELYGSLESNVHKVELMDFMEEIKASEFYKIIEES